MTIDTHMANIKTPFKRKDNKNKDKYYRFIWWERDFNIIYQCNMATLLIISQISNFVWSYFGNTKALTLTVLSILSAAYNLFFHSVGAVLFFFIYFLFWITWYCFFIGYIFFRKKILHASIVLQYMPPRLFEVGIWFLWWHYVLCSTSKLHIDMFLLAIYFF